MQTLKTNCLPDTGSTKCFHRSSIFPLEQKLKLNLTTIYHVANNTVCIKEEEEKSNISLEFKYPLGHPNTSLWPHMNIEALSDSLFEVTQTLFEDLLVCKMAESKIFEKCRG